MATLYQFDDVICLTNNIEIDADAVKPANIELRREFVEKYSRVMAQISKICGSRNHYILLDFTYDIVGGSDVLIKLGAYLAMVRPHYNLLKQALDLREQYYQVQMQGSRAPAMDLLKSVTVNIGTYSYVDPITDWDRYKNSGELPVERQARLLLREYVNYADKLIKYYEKIERNLAAQYAVELGGKPQNPRINRKNKLTKPTLDDLMDRMNSEMPGANDLVSFDSCYNIIMPDMAPTRSAFQMPQIDDDYW